MREADPDADLEGSLAAWRRYRRRRRVAEVHWVDALYQAYITAILGAITLFALAAIVGDEHLSAGALADVRADGADWLGALTAAVLALGLRSGSRGGPLALERSEVRHVLLAPVDRTTALRGPAVRQLRFLAFVAAVVGVEGGLLASARLPHHAGLWMAWGALYAVATLALAYGAALLAAAVRLPSPVATAAGVGLVAWGVADALDAAEGNPLVAWGDLGLGPFHQSWTMVVAVLVSLAVVVAGVVRIGDLSLEAAERRSSLVGQLRFAATLQDLRTVVVLRRQLAMELPRLTPWARVAVHGTGRAPVWSRGLRGVLRWPAARVGRLVLLGIVAGLALRGAWDGTTPLVAVAGLALFVAGLDAVEPLAAEVDRPTRSRTLPLEPGELHLRHLPIAVVVMILTGVVAAVAAVAVRPSAEAVAVAAVCVGPGALGAVAGAATSVLSGAPEHSAWSLAPPEAAGVRLVARTAWPIVLAAGGTLPVLAARAAADAGRSPELAAGQAGVLVAVGFVAVAAWVVKRDALHETWAAVIDPDHPNNPRNRARALAAEAEVYDDADEELTDAR